VLEMKHDGESNRIESNRIESNNKTESVNTILDPNDMAVFENECNDVKVEVIRVLRFSLL
jgi:hypothetical protein